MELSVSWEDNFEQAELRKVEELIDKYEDQGWKFEFYHLAVGFPWFCWKKMLPMCSEDEWLQTQED